MKRKLLFLLIPMLLVGCSKKNEVVEISTTSSYEEQSSEVESTEELTTEVGTEENKEIEETKGFKDVELEGFKFKSDAVYIPTAPKEVIVEEEKAKIEPEIYLDEDGNEVVIIREPYVGPVTESVDGSTKGFTGTSTDSMKFVYSDNFNMQFVGQYSLANIYVRELTGEFTEEEIKSMGFKTYHQYYRERFLTDEGMGHYAQAYNNAYIPLGTPYENGIGLKEPEKFFEGVDPTLSYGATEDSSFSQVLFDTAVDTVFDSTYAVGVHKVLKDESGETFYNKFILHATAITDDGRIFHIKVVDDFDEYLIPYLYETCENCIIVLK